MGEAANALYRAHLGPSWRTPNHQALTGAVDGKTILITGASAGIGAATARLLASAGAEVLLVARRTELLDRQVGDITRAGGRARALTCDLANQEAVDGLVNRLCTQEAGIDVVISNAGKSIKRSLTDTTGRFHDVTRTNAVNYLGPIQLLMGILPAMRRRGKGQLVNISSVSATIPFPLFSVYSGSKAGFEGWLRSIAPEILVDGVSTTSIHLPLVHTEMSRANYARFPGLTEKAAAEVVGRSLVHRPRLLCPWWARLADPILSNAQPIFDHSAVRSLRRS